MSFMTTQSSVDPTQLIELLAVSTSINTDAETTRRQAGSRMLDIFLIGLLSGVGTGGLSVPVRPQSSPSSSQTWVSTRNEPPEPNEVEDVSAPARISKIRGQLSLNMKQVADAMQVGRPAVYAWFQGATPRDGQQQRLKELHDIADKWRSLSSVPVGKYLIIPLENGASLLDLIRANDLDHTEINRAIGQISSIIQATERRRKTSGYRSAASVMKELQVKPASREIEQQRINDASDLG